MKIKKFILPALIVASVIGGLAALKFAADNSYPTPVFSHASWAYGYGSIDSLYSDSDLVAVIHVNGLVSQEDESRQRSSNSVFEVEVIEPMLGCEKGDVINIWMTGMKSKEYWYEIADDPLMEAAQEFLVFTDKNADGTYSILGGPQGRFEYKKGKINSLHLVNSRVGQLVGDFEIKNQPLDVVAEEVSQAAARVQIQRD